MIKKIIFLLCLAQLSSSYAMEPSTKKPTSATERPTPEEIREGFIEKGNLSESTEVKKVEKPMSLFSEQIIIFKSNTCGASVAKVFKRFDDFLSENQKITEMQATIELINEQHECNTNLPIIAARRGDIEIKGVGIILFEKAKGKTLDDAYFNNLLSNNLLGIADDKIKEVFTSIGKQFGTLDKFMYEGEKKVLIQGDSRGANFMYDEKNHQLYWIDLDGLAFKNDASGITNLKFLDNLLVPDSFDKLTKFGINSIYWAIDLSDDVPYEIEAGLDNITQLKDYIPYLKYIPAGKFLELKAEFAKLIGKMHKEVLTIKSGS